MAVCRRRNEWKMRGNRRRAGKWGRNRTGGKKTGRRRSSRRTGWRKNGKSVEEVGEMRKEQSVGRRERERENEELMSYSVGKWEKQSEFSRVTEWDRDRQSKTMEKPDVMTEWHSSDPCARSDSKQCKFTHEEFHFKTRRPEWNMRVMSACVGWR